MTAGLAALLLLSVLPAEPVTPRLNVFDRAPVLDVNAADFPACSMLDLAREPAPAGACGRVFPGSDGRLYFEDGSRAIFWGINVAKTSVFQSTDTIDRAVDAIASAGFNLVRFHHFDDVTGLLPRDRAGKQPRLDPDKLACLDYWIKRLGDRGIYVYLDLLDYRTFWPEEGIADGPDLDRGAKPYAVFSPKLLDLQIAYARELLIDHRNPLTGKTYAEDPAVLFVELCDENGLFRSWRDGLKLRPPYAAELQAGFNSWLHDRYGDDAKLREAWTDGRGACALSGEEALSANGVHLATTAGSSPRHTDTALFFADVHRRYFDALRQALRTGGVRELLLGGVADPSIPADLRAAASGLDFVGVNWYWAHPVFFPDTKWKPPFLFDAFSAMTPGRLDDFPVTVAAARVYHKPLVVREWGACWPNPYRGSAMLGAAAYGSLQDVDAMILFCYGADPDQRGLSHFDVSHDPARWGLATACAYLFRNRLLGPEKHTVTVGYSSADVLLHPLSPMVAPLHKLGYLSRVSNCFFDSDLTADADLLVSSGRSSAGKYPPAAAALLFANSPFADAYRHEESEGLDAANGCSVATIPSTRATFSFGGTIFDAGVTRDHVASPAYFLPDILNTKDLRPIGKSTVAGAALGVRDLAHNRYYFKSLPDDWALRAAVDALGQVTGDESLSHRALDAGLLSADDGHLIVDRGDNVLFISTDQVAALAGDLGGKALRAGPLAVTTDTPTAAVVWLNLDSRPPAESTRWLLRMVSVAVNTGQDVQPDHDDRFGPVARLVKPGGLPILTLGKAGGHTSISLAGHPLINLDLVNGSWELLRDGDDLYLWCDTPSAHIELPLVANPATVTALAPDGKPAGGTPAEAGPRPQPIEYPSGVLLLRAGPVREGQQ